MGMGMDHMMVDGFEFGFGGLEDPRLDLGLDRRLNIGLRQSIISETVRRVSGMENVGEVGFSKVGCERNGTTTTGTTTTTTTTTPRSTSEFVIREPVKRTIPLTLNLKATKKIQNE
jgi:hypothetical protein